MINGCQIRAARALLKWSAATLGKKAKVTRETISKIEDEIVRPRENTLADIARVFDENGVEFIENSGVRFKSNEIEIYEGAERFNQFYDFMHEHLKNYGGDVCISVVDENLLAKYRKDPDLHRKRMHKLVHGGNVTFRILATKSRFVSTYAQYKWQPQQSAAPTSFYAFGNCLALISFVHKTPPYVVLHKAGPFAEAYRQAFNIAWKNAAPPPTNPTPDTRS